MGVKLITVLNKNTKETPWSR